MFFVPPFDKRMTRSGLVSGLAVAVFVAVMAASATAGTVEPFQDAAALRALLLKECSSLGATSSPATREACAKILGSDAVSRAGSDAVSRAGSDIASAAGLQKSVRAATCARLRPDAPMELRLACGKNDFGGSLQSTNVSLDGVAACVDPCDPEHTCGKVLTACGAPGSISSLRCDVTHVALKTREGTAVSGPHAAPFRVFVVATPGCLRRNDEGGFMDDAAAIRLLMTFPEKLLLGDSGRLSVALPLNWGLTLSGKGDAEFVIPPAYRLPPDTVSHLNPMVPVVSVFKSSRAHQENGFRVTTLTSLANRLHIASAREPDQKDALFSVLPIEMTFTATCREGGAGLSALVVRILEPGAQQKGRNMVGKAAVTVAPAGAAAAGAAAAGAAAAGAAPAGAAGAGAAAAAAAAAGAGANESGAGQRSPSARWVVGSPAASPISKRSVGALRIAWICLTVDTWTGRVTDCREVLIGEKGTSVSRTRNTDVFVDPSDDLPLNVLGLGGVAFGIGRAADNIFGMSAVPQMSLVD
jgi:hypothetical protein